MQERQYKYQTASPVDWSKTKEVTGVIVGKTMVTIGKRQVQAVQIHTGKQTVQVLGSARLEGAINAAEPGDMIHIVNNGKLKLKGGKTMHDFAVEVWEGGANVKTGTKTTKRKPGTRAAGSKRKSR